MTTLESTKMPPLAHEAIDESGAALIREWIESLPGPPALAPPTIRPKGGDSLRGPVRVAIEHGDPEAVVRYTLDGSSPGKRSRIYEGPIELTGSATVRARAYRDGWKRSIIAQETFVIEGAP